MIFLIIPVAGEAAVSSSQSGYMIGIIVAILIMGYLIYTLLRPEKF